MHNNQTEKLELFLGRNSCYAIWRHRPESVQSIYMLQSDYAESPSGVRLVAEAEARKIKVHFLIGNAEELGHIFELQPSEKESLRWQVVAMLAPQYKPISFDSWLPQLKSSHSATSLIPFLDGVSLPMNIAKFTRSCAHFGVTAILSGEDHLPELDSHFGRLSCGAIEEVQMITYTNVSPTLQALKQCDYEIVTLSPHADASLYEFTFSPKTVFILGDERNGASEESFSAADVKLSLPNRSQTVDSLNVSTMGAILLFEFYRQQYRHE